MNIIPVGTDHTYEVALYAAVNMYLTGKFCREHGIVLDQQHYFVDETYRYNSGDALGPYSRPDFVGVTLHKLRYLATDLLEIHAFQVKRFQDDTKHLLVGSLEAAYYKKWAHYSYLVLHLPFDDRDTSRFQDVVGECTRHGVGLIVFDDADYMDSFHMYLRPTLGTPYPPDVERFIENRITEGGRSKIDRWRGR